MSTEAGGDGVWRGCLRAGWPALAVSAVLFLLLWPVLVGDQTLFYRDLYLQYIGTGRLLHSGPLSGGLTWDALLNGGQPLLGNPNRFVLYPSRALYLVVDPVTAMNWEIALHLLLGGIGASWLARRLGIGSAGCVVAGAAFALSGLSISITSHLGRVMAYHWVPWIVLGVHAGLCRPRRSFAVWQVLVPVFLAFQWLTGTAELAAITAVILGGWVAAYHLGDGGGFRPLVRLSALVGLGLGMAAIQIVPAAEMVQRSERAAYARMGASVDWSLHPWRLPELAVPGFCGPIDEFFGGLHYWGAGLFDRGFPLVVSLYLGVSVLFLACIGWARSGDDPTWRRLRALFTALIGISVVLALGAHLPLLGRAWAVIPGLDVVRYPVKMLLMAGLPVALLAGRGCDRWFGEDAASARRFGLAALGAGACCGAAAGWISLGLSLPLLEWVFPGRGILAGDGLPAQVAATAVVLATCGMIGLAAGRVRQALLAAAAAAVVVGDLFMASVPVLPTAPERVLAETPAAVDDLRRELSGGRFYRDTDEQGPEVRLTEDRAWESADGFIRDVSFSVASTFMVPMVLNQDIAGLADRRMARLAAEAEGSEPSELLQVFKVAAVEVLATEKRLDHPELELVKTYPRAGGLPLALYRFRPGSESLRWVAMQRETLSGAQALEALMDPGFDAHSQVVREVQSPTTRLRPAPWTGLAPRAEVLRGRVIAPEDGFLAIAVPWHRDLEVRDNGVLVGAERLNYAFVGFPVESGLHEVRVEFVSQRVLAGGLMTVASVVTWLAFVLTPWRRSRPHGAHSSISSGRASSPR